MRPIYLLKPLGLVPAALALALSLASLPAGSQDSPNACADALSGNAHSDSEGLLLSDGLEILSWNIQKASKTGWAEDLARHGAGVHFAFIQEASLQAPIAQSIAADLHSVFAHGYSDLRQQTGVLTLSAGSPSADCRLITREPWLGTPKATGIATYPLANRNDRLLAINLHAVNFELGLASFQAQLDALRRVLHEHAGPVILAGDLNTWSDTRQAAVDDFTTEHELSAVTFEPDLRSRAFGRALDHIYVRGLGVEDARVIPVSSSDHNPLRVRLALN